MLRPRIKRETGLSRGGGHSGIVSRGSSTKEMQAPSGSGERRSKYKYARALSFLRSTIVSRSTGCSTREPAVELDPSGAIQQEFATGDHVERPNPSAPSLMPGPLAPSISAAASWQTSSHEAAGDEVAFPLPHPSDTAATSRTPLSSGRQRQRGQERSYAPEFLHLNASLQNSIKLLRQQISAGFNMLNKSIMELRSLLDRMHSDANKSPKHLFFQSVVGHMENLTPDQQMHVMHGCQVALVQVTSQALQPAPVVPPTPTPSPATVPPPPTPSPFQLSPFQVFSYHTYPYLSSPLTSPYQNPPTPSPFLLPHTSVPPLPTQPHIYTNPSTSDPHQPGLQSPTIDVVCPVNPSGNISTPHYTTL
ncbi:uncharacterized protein [Dendrobates tinctorius]|uniref:uncharacterized protein n=1 Tax=Dendrobates tinctorius TaxID=92724 RepID=UPI003CCA6647